MEATAQVLVDTQHHVGAVDEAEAALSRRRRLRDVTVEVHDVSVWRRRGTVVRGVCAWCRVDKYEGGQVCGKAANKAWFTRNVIRTVRPEHECNSHIDASLAVARHRHTVSTIVHCIT